MMGVKPCERKVWHNADASVAQGIASAVSDVANVFIGATSANRQSRLQEKIASREFLDERERLINELRLSEDEQRQKFALSAVEELNKRSRNQLIKNALIGGSIFLLLAIGIFYASKKSK